jgi:hypothetical protein
VLEDPRKGFGRNTQLRSNEALSVVQNDRQFTVRIRWLGMP